ncbi:MAG TPA: hypothetical protein VL122_13410 [Nitrospirota bacterium]|nr:hypothetical protein [Nitrospirota bacterium]
MSPLHSGKLTKKLLINLAEGLYLVSNVGHTPLQPIFAEMVTALNMREAQWRKIVELGANNRLCHVFKSREDYQKYFNKPIMDLLMS